MTKRRGVLVAADSQSGRSLRIITRFIMQSCTLRRWFFVCLLITHCFFGAVICKRTTLYLAGFFPTNPDIPEGEVGRGVIPAVNLALEHVNSSPFVLRGYHLALVWNDTKCDAAVGMKSFFDMLSKQPAKIILFGDACTSVTDPIAKASQFFHLVQLSYADTHPMYTLENYPNFFRVIPSEAAFNPARLALLRRFNWTRVGTLYQNLPRYSLPHSKLMTLLDTCDIEIAGTQSFTDKLQNELQKLKEKDVRIIIGNFEEEWARHIFCRAYQTGLYGRKYQWIIVGTYRHRWWEVRDPNVTCKPEELREALEGYIATDVLPLSSSDEITASGLTAAEYEAEYSRTRKLEYSRFHGYAYDGIWTAALAIQSVIKKLRATKLPYTIKDFEYRDQFWGTLFKEAFNETEFTGVTGPVSFVRNERKGLILLKQFQQGREVKVGEYDSNTDFLDLSVGERITWRGSYVPPLDRTLIVISPSRVNLTIYLIVVIFAILGIILATVFLVINIKFRNQRYIKMSSPYLNNMIIVGCILTYISVILLGLDSGLTSEKNFRYICAARAWVLMSGFTLAFGSMFSKTWRVHAIFTNIKLNKKVIKDYKLFIVVGVLVMIDIIILTTWQIIDPFFRETSKGEAILSPENDDLQFIPEMEFCQSHKMTIFLGCIYAYKGLLMAFGCFLAWETRHVSIPALNDSKYIGMSVYNVVIMCVIGCALSFVLRDQQDAAFVIISIFIIFCSTTTLCLVFVPKVRLLVELKRNPQAGDRRVRATLKPLKKSRRDSDDLGMQSRIKMLQDENIRCRQKLEEKNIALQALLAQLKQFEEVSSSGKTAGTPVAERNSIVSEGETSETLPVAMSSDDIKSVISKGSQDRLDEGTPVEERMQMRKSSMSLQVPQEMPSEKEGRLSCPDLAGSQKIHHHVDQAAATVEAMPSKRSPLEQLRPQLLIDRMNREVKFAEAESSSTTSSETIQSKKSPAGAEPKDLPLESDDTSYARAIKNTQIINGLSSSCDEDTDRCEGATYSEAAESDSQSRHYTSSVRRRAKSLGALRTGTLVSDGGGNSRSNEPGVSVINASQTQSSMLPPLFPYFSQLASDAQPSNRTAQKDAMFSSYPTIKCDIVEYL